MANILINLLPIEFRQAEIKRTKFNKVQAFGVAVILLMAFLASLTVALRILQSQRIFQTKNRLSQAEEKISSLKTVQGSLVLLKNRLKAIDQYLGTPSQQSQMYQLVIGLLPANAAVSSITVDKGGEVIILATVSDPSSLEDLTTNLLSRDKNQDKISQVALESINRGRDGIYRLSLKIKPKT